MDVNITINIDDRYVDFFKRMAKSRRVRIQILTLLIGIPFALQAAPVTKPYTFTPNTVARAAEVNANFDTLYTKVNDSDTRLTALETPQVLYATAAAVSGVPRLAATSLSQTNPPGGHVGVYSVAGGSDYVLCPIQLPQGAVINRVSYLFYDNDASNDTSAWLYRTDGLSIASLYSSGISATTNWINSGALSHTINNTLGGYYVYMQVNSNSGANIVPVAFRVQYSY